MRISGNYGEKLKEIFLVEDFQRSYILKHMGGSPTPRCIRICGSRQVGKPYSTLFAPLSRFLVLLHMSHCSPSVSSCQSPTSTVKDNFMLKIFYFHSFPFKTHQSYFPIRSPLLFPGKIQT